MKLLLIDVHNPQQFINRGNAWQRYNMARNAKWRGTPIVIPTMLLSVNLNELIPNLSAYTSRPNY